MNPTLLDARAVRRPLRAALATAALLLGLLAVLLMPAAALAGAQSYSDPAGDAPGGAPDITDVSVMPSADGSAYSFAVNLNGAAYRSDFFLYLYVDTTGDNVAEYLVRLLGNENRIEANRWNGSAWAPFTASILEGTSSLSPETIRLGVADLGGAQSFHFWLQAWKYVASSQPACCYDYAGVFAYAATAAGGGSGGSGGGSGGGGTSTRTLPPPPPPPPFETPAGAPGGSTSSQGGTNQSAGTNQPAGTAGKPAEQTKENGAEAEATTAAMKATVPALLRAGGRFAVAVRVESGSHPVGRVACRVTLSGKQVSAGSATLAEGRAACVLRAPAGSRGRLARISVEVTTGGRTMRAILLRRVR